MFLSVGIHKNGFVVFIASSLLHMLITCRLWHVIKRQYVNPEVNNALCSVFYLHRYRGVHFILMNKGIVIQVLLRIFLFWPAGVLQVHTHGWYFYSSEFWEVQNAIQGFKGCFFTLWMGLLDLAIMCQFFTHFDWSLERLCNAWSTRKCVLEV